MGASNAKTRLATADARLLPNWRPGAARLAILEFVERVCDPRSPEFVPVSQRIAVFENDGTLFPESPFPVQVLFALDHIERLARQTVSLRETQPYKAFLHQDLKTIANFSRWQSLVSTLALEAGSDAEELSSAVSAWFEERIHPFLGRPYHRCAYVAQLELIALLRRKRFKTFIVTAGGADFLRCISGRLYGIEPDRVIGSALKAEVAEVAQRLAVLQRVEIGNFNDRESKVVNIRARIGQRPIFAFGGSDGDLSMLRYTREGRGARLALLLRHDDPHRESTHGEALGRLPPAALFDEARSLGLHVVSIREDWGTVFGGAADTSQSNQKEQS